MKSKSTNVPSGKKNPVWLILAAAVLIGIGVLVWQIISPFFPSAAPNRAEEAAKPLETALVAAGLSKKCSQGYTGHGLDSKAPTYSAIFETSLDKEQAANVVTKAAQSAGFNLTYKQSPYDYIGWYSDETSRDSPYGDLVPGKMKVGLNIYSGGNNVLGCADKTQAAYDSAHAAVVLNVALPDIKR